MSKHTKGPWESNNGEVTTERIDGRSYRRIAAVQDYGVGSLPEVDEANARLIAAAPDLLEACKMLMYYYEAFRDKSPIGDTERDDIASARAVIAKATGK